MLLEKINSNKITTILLIQISILLFNTLYAGSLEYHIATYNIRGRNVADQKNNDAWEDRKTNLCNLILYNNFDILCTQECYTIQSRNMLTFISEVYDCIGQGKTDHGETNIIFYKKNNFKVVASGTFWFSETCEKPTKGWDAKAYRVCTWGNFFDINNKNNIYVFNIHLDWSGYKARQESMKLLIDKINKICPYNSNIIIAGDFNGSQTSNVYKILSKEKNFKDAFLAAKYKWNPTGTFSDFKYDNLNNGRLDHIWVNRAAEISRYGILNNTYYVLKNEHINNLEQLNNKIINQSLVSIHTPSDHYPVSVWVKFSN